jgi:hypothetical protein
MNLYINVFNCNDYSLRVGREEFCAKFGKETFVKEIKPFLKKGIMSIFAEDPNEHTLFYAKAVAKTVQRKMDKK